MTSRSNHNGIAANTPETSSLTLLASQLAEGRGDTVAKLFRENNSPAPSVIWSPSRLDLLHPVHRDFAAKCDITVQDDGRLLKTDFDAMDLGDMRDYLMVVEPIGDGTDFTYVTYGPEIVAIFGRDMTGARTSEIGGHISTFFIALYIAVLERGEWALSNHEPPMNVFARAWRRLIVPLYDQTGAIVQIAVFNIPDNDLRQGFEAIPDPVLLIDEEGRVVYSNSAACAQFGKRVNYGAPMKVADYCGFPVDYQHGADFDPMGMPEGIKHSIELMGTLVIHYNITTKKTVYRDRPFTTVVIRIE